MFEPESYNHLKSTINLWCAVSWNSMLWGTAAGACALMGGSVDLRRIYLVSITASALSTCWNLNTFFDQSWVERYSDVKEVQYPISVFALTTIHLLALRGLSFLNNKFTAALMTINIIISGILLYTVRDSIAWRTVFPHWNSRPVPIFFRTLS